MRSEKSEREVGSIPVPFCLVVQPRECHCEEWSPGFEVIEKGTQPNTLTNREQVRKLAC